MPHDFDNYNERQGTSSLKWDRYGVRDVIPLWVADMDFRSPEPLIEALRERVDHGVFGYTRVPKELVNVTVGHVREQFDWEISREWLVWLPGLVSGLNVACRAVGAEGDDVATFMPVYPPFLTAPGFAKRNLLSVPLQCSAGHWDIDFDAFEASITHKTSLLNLCNPHNPVGRVFSRSELLRLADICLAHKVAICSDEIHNGLVLDEDQRHVCIASLSDSIAQRTITLMAPSKTFNIPGLGCSFAIIPSVELRKSFLAVIQGIVPHVNLFGYVATLSAYRDGGPWHRELIEYLRGNRDLVLREVAKMPGLSIFPVEATYLAWIDARALGLANPARFFEDAGVGLSDGAEFGAPGFLRLNFGCPRALLQKALDRMHQAIARRPQ